MFYVDLDYVLFSLCMEESTCTQRISANIKHDRVVRGMLFIRFGREGSPDGRCDRWQYLTWQVKNSRSLSEGLELQALKGNSGK